MEDINIKGMPLNDDELEGVSGGAGDKNSGNLMCPQCKDQPIDLGNSRVARINGANVTLYKCDTCFREFTMRQIEGLDPLGGHNYTGQGETVSSSM